jgi:hypothetical protein
VALVSRLVGRPIIRPASDALHLPDDTELLGVSFDGITVKNVRLDRTGDGAHESFTVPTDGFVDLPRHVRLVELDAINLSKDGDPAATGSMTLHCGYLGRRFTLPAIAIELGAGTALHQVATFTTDQSDRRQELLTHLQGHREYYSHAIFRTLDSATLTFLLGQFRWNGRPLIDQVEPRPVTVAGNYLILRAPVEATESSGIVREGTNVPWGQLLEERGLSLTRSSDERLIPIATGGVFAEAVLGRSNAAEKLDMTRFWHWEDSPIPLLPTEIAPVGTGSRATAENLTPGQLSPPVLNIVNPTNLPDPAGLGAALNTLANLNFRDMSGLAGTQDLARAASAGTLAAATDAGRLASENLKTEAQKAVAMGQIAADVAKAAIAAGAGGGSKPKEGSKASMAGVSREGALLNQGRKMDQERKAASPGGGGGGGGTGAGSGSSETPDGSPGEGGRPLGGVGGGLGGAIGGGGGTGESLEGNTFSEIVHGPLSGPVGRLANNVLEFASDNATPKPQPKKPPGPPPPPPPRAQITSEIYAHVRVDIPELWVTTPNEEVKVIVARTPPAGFWNPNERDFVEMARNNVIPQNVKKIENVLGFLRVIPINFPRTNVYGYSHTSSILGLTSEQSDTGVVSGFQDPPTDILNNRGLSVAVLNQIEAEITADPTGRLALEIKEIRSAADKDRELWIYTAVTTLNDQLMQKIANLFRIRTVTMKQPVWFIPDVTVRPINRKRFGLGADVNDALNTLTDDPYTFDGNVRIFVPQP